MIAYLMGPMRGIEYYNFPAFDRVAKLLREHGITVLSPADMDREHGFDAMKCHPSTDWNAIPEGFSLSECVDRDLDAVKKCDVVVRLNGWGKSTGAQAENAVAKWRQKEAIDEDSLDLWLADWNNSEPIIVQDAIMQPDPKTGGVKGKKLARFSLLPWDALRLVAEHFGKCGGDGTREGKYAERNWEKGYAWSLCKDAEDRHMVAFWQYREDVDKDSKSLHLTAHAWHALVMLAMYIRGIGTDDRPTIKGEGK